MGKTTTLAAVALMVGLAGAAHPQEASEPDAAEAARRPLRTIRVLQHPYDLASFYASRPGSPTITPPVPHDPAYALASHYRSSQAGPPPGPGPWIWAAFWANGYGAQRPTPFRGYRRAIGDNGDLFLAVPFLAPVGPLSGAFPGF